MCFEKINEKNRCYIVLGCMAITLGAFLIEINDLKVQNIELKTKVNMMGKSIEKFNTASDIYERVSKITLDKNGQEEIIKKTKQLEENNKRLDLLIRQNDYIYRESEYGKLYFTDIEGILYPDNEEFIKSFTELLNKAKEIKLKKVEVYALEDLGFKFSKEFIMKHNTLSIGECNILLNNVKNKVDKVQIADVDFVLKGANIKATERQFIIDDMNKLREANKQLEKEIAEISLYLNSSVKNNNKNNSKNNSNSDKMAGSCSCR